MLAVARAGARSGVVAAAVVDVAAAADDEEDADDHVEPADDTDDDEGDDEQPSDLECVSWLCVVVQALIVLPVVKCCS